MIAYMDESIRRTPGGFYLLALAVVVTDDLDSARHNVRSVLRPRQPRFHWRNESDTSRAAMLAQLAMNSPKLILGYAGRPLPGRQARARALCLERATWDLHSHAIPHLVIESREQRNDNRDAATIERARRAGKASPTLTYAFERPGNEPLLWLADAACGAIAAHLGDGNSTYIDQLPPGLVTVVQVSS